MIIGITGGIGSGKSTIARELEKQGFAVYDCDREAKRIIAENKAVQSAIIHLLGEEAFVNGHYNTAYVAQRVFDKKELLEKLNQIVHPAVKEDILQRSGLTVNEANGLTAKRSNSAAVWPAKPVLYIESAILCEAGLDELCEKIIVVEAPEAIRIERVIARDYHGNASPANINKVRARVRAQENAYAAIPQNKRLTIINDGQTSIDELVQSLLTNS